jgi:DNA-directed RNA polymerase specialized sigma24 family protein
VEAEEMLATSTESDPEGTAELYEQLQKVERWSRGLPPEQVEVLRCIHGVGMSLDEAAAALGRRGARCTISSRMRRRSSRRGRGSPSVLRRSGGKG